MQEPQLGTVTNAKAGDEEFVEFVRAGEHVVGAFECVACSYGAVVRGPLPSCPTCRETLWERSTWTPFATALSGPSRIRQ